MYVASNLPFYSPYLFQSWHSRICRHYTFYRVDKCGLNAIGFTLKDMYMLGTMIPDIEIDYLEDIDEQLYPYIQTCTYNDCRGFVTVAEDGLEYEFGVSGNFADCNAETTVSRYRLPSCVFHAREPGSTPSPRTKYSAYWQRFSVPIRRSRKRGSDWKGIRPLISAESLYESPSASDWYQPKNIYQ